MLPSSHLIVKESPQEAARRIAREQLDLPDLAVGEPKVVSEVYAPRRFPENPAHWDLEFIFRGEVGTHEVRKARAWNDLQFVDLDVTPKSEIARSHEDILESAGLRFGRA
jgi:ADP-ribose pyrophosphatase YjhB (NUDIX family)